jgi:hypothetical protein
LIDGTDRRKATQKTLTDIHVPEEFKTCKFGVSASYCMAITPLNNILHQKLIVIQLFTKFPKIFPLKPKDSLPLNSALSLINPIHSVTPFSLETYFNIILEYMPRFLMWSLGFGFFSPKFYVIYGLIELE